MLLLLHLLIELLLVLALLPHFILSLLNLEPSNHMDTSTRAPLTRLTRMNQLLLLARKILVVLVLLHCTLFLPPPHVNFLVTDHIEETSRFTRRRGGRRLLSPSHHSIHLLLQCVLKLLRCDRASYRAVLHIRSVWRNIAALTERALATSNRCLPGAWWLPHLSRNIHRCEVDRLVDLSPRRVSLALGLWDGWRSAKIIALTLRHSLLPNLITAIRRYW